MGGVFFFRFEREREREREKIFDLLEDKKDKNEIKTKGKSRGKINFIFFVSFCPPFYATPKELSLKTHTHLRR